MIIEHPSPPCRRRRRALVQAGRASRAARVAALSSVWVVSVLFGPLVAWGQAPSVYSGPRTDIIAAAADATRDVTIQPEDRSFEIRNYTDEDIKTCFYYPDDKIMAVPLGIKGDKDNCYSTPAAGKKSYRTDEVEWSKFRKKPGYYHTLERRLNVKVFRKTRLGTYKKYCTKKNLFQPDQLRIKKEGKKSCKATSIRSYKPTYLRNQGITRGADVLRWTEAHSEDLNYLVARSPSYLFIAVRGTSNYQNRKMNGELTKAEARSQADLAASRASARPVLRKGASVHFGWWKVAGKIYDQIEPTVEDWAGKSGQKREIILTGHSMGGAVATYLATMLMDDGYRNVHLVAFGAPRVTTKSFVLRFNELTTDGALSVAFVERGDDPRVDDWTSKMEKVPTLTIWEPRSYDGSFVAYPSGCPDPHSGADYHAKAKNPGYSCIASEDEDEGDEEGDVEAEAPGGRRRVGPGEGSSDGEQPPGQPDRRRRDRTQPTR